MATKSEENTEVKEETTPQPPKKEEYKGVFYLDVQGNKLKPDGTKIE